MFAQSELDLIRALAQPRVGGSRSPCSSRTRRRTAGGTFWAYDVFLEDGGMRLIYLPLINYAHGNLDAVQSPRGYRWTVKAGTVTFDGGAWTGETPGRLVRGARPAP